MEIEQELLEQLKEKEIELLYKSIQQRDKAEIDHWMKVARSRLKKYKTILTKIWKGCIIMIKKLKELDSTEKSICVLTAIVLFGLFYMGITGLINTWF